MLQTANFETNILYKFLKIVLYALLLTPLWVWSSFFFPFITSKVLYFRVLVEIALLLYILLALKFPELRPRLGWIGKAVWLYLSVTLIASLLGVDFANSFWGTVERGEGIVTILHFAVYFTILSQIFRSKKDWIRYLSFTVILIAFIGAYGLAQVGCSDAATKSGICNLLLPTQGSRISSTIGNASFFAAFLMFGVFLSWYLSNETTAKWKRWFFYGVSLPCLYAIFVSETRGAVVAILAVLAIYALFTIFKSSNIKIRLGSAAFLIIMGTLSAILFLKPSILPKALTNIGIVHRIKNISPSDITTQSRFDTWQASWKAWQDRPALGYGYENYNIAFNKYFPARIYKDAGSQIWFDRAHNIFFDVGVTSGILGLVSYLGIFVAAFAALYRLFRDRDIPWQQPLILALLLLGYFFQNLFVFDTQATYLVFFLVLALIVSLRNKYLAGEANPKAVSYPPGIFLPSILLVLVLLAMYFVNWKPALANRAAIRAMRYGKTQEYSKIKPAFEKSLSYGTYMDAEIRQRLVDNSLEAINSAALSAEEKQQIFSYIYEQLKKSIREYPNDVKNYLYLMSFLNRTAGVNSAYSAEIFVLGEQALELSPTRPQIYQELGQAYFFAKEFDKGLQQFRNALELNPEPKESHMNLLLAGIVAGREDIVEAESKFITEHPQYKFTVADYLNMARAYYQAGNKIKLVEMSKKIVELEPQNVEHHARLAAAYGEICDVPNARTEVFKAIEINSAFQGEGLQFLGNLEATCRK